MAKYTIDYGFGKAQLYIPSEDWEERFERLAYQCFGIRKSIMQTVLIEKTDEKPRNTIDGEYERLEHNGDVIIWNEHGEKIKSEFDF